MSNIKGFLSSEFTLCILSVVSVQDSKSSLGSFNMNEIIKLNAVNAEVTDRRTIKRLFNLS